MNNNNQIIKQKYNFFDDIANKYKEYNNLINNDNLNKLKNFSEEFRETAKELIKENRKLRIGIVGQIKVGKSSFLNTLLFQGEDLLPKAATPTTAALTVISYSKETSAEINFFNKSEWKEIKNNAQKYDKIIENTRKKIKDEKNNLSINNKNKLTESQIKRKANIPSEIKSAKEIFDKAKDDIFDIESYFGKTKVIKSDSVSDLIGKLNDYVGAKGKFSPLVKDTRIYVNNNNLKNFEVIDTPGMNDPVVSRGQMTKKFIGKCDVVFLLSRASQFLDENDIRVMTQNIPSKGIRNVELIASMFDSALLDEGDNYNSFQEAVVNVYEDLKKQANNTIIPRLEKQPDNNILQNLKKSLPPYVISAITYDIAEKYNTLDEQKRHILNRLEETFPKCDFDPETLKYLANIDDIRDNKFEKLRDEKDKIISKRFQDLLKGQKREFSKRLSEIKEEAEMDLERLNNSDINQLNKKQHKLNKNIKKARKNIEMVFDDYITEIKTEFSKMLSDIKQTAQSYKNMNIKKGSREETYEVNVSKWWNIFSWGETETKKNVIEYDYVNVSEIVEKINKLVVDVEKKIAERIEGIINIKTFKKELINSVINVFDLSNENFDTKEILIPVRKVVNKITIPDIKFKSEKYEKMIFNKFRGKVKNEKINKLRQLQFEIINKIIENINDTVKKKTDQITHNLEETRRNFVDNVIKESESKIENIKKQISEKKKYIKRYESLIDSLDDDITEIKNA